MEMIAPLGFERVLMGNLSLRDQIGLMSETSLVIGVHGAALANIIFMPKDATVIELIPASESLQGLVINLAQRLGLGFKRLVGQVVHRPEQALLHDQYKDFIIAPEALSAVLRDLA